MQNTEKTSLPSFEFSNGYDLKCVDMGDDGIKIELSGKYEEGRAILLTDKACTAFLIWMQSRIGKRAIITNKNPALQSIYEKRKQSLQVEVLKTEKIIEDLGILCTLIEIDTGMSAEEIRNYNHYTQKHVFARDILSLILKVRFKLPTTKIAELIGAKSHASVIISSKKFPKQINEELYTSPDLLQIYQDAKAKYKQVKTRK